MLKKVSCNFPTGLLIFFVTLFLSYRSLLLGPPDQILGHNWDWTFPGNVLLFKNIQSFSSSTWYRFNFGSPLYLNLSHFIPNTIVSFLPKIMSLRASVLIVLFFVHLMSFLSARRLVYYWSDGTASSLPALLYSFSPFLFNEIIGGSWYMWISYAFAPLLFYYYLRIVIENKLHLLPVSLLTAIFVVSSLQNFVLLESIFIIYVCLFLVTSRQDAWAIIKRWLILHLFLFIVNLYWLAPLATDWSNFIASKTSSSFNGDFDSLSHTTQTVFTVLSLTGYLDRNIYEHLLPRSIVAVFWALLFCFWVVFFLLLLYSIRTKLYPRRVGTSFIVIVLFSIFCLLGKGANPPLGQINMYLFRHILLLSLYRSPQHLMFAPNFLILLLFSNVLFVVKTGLNRYYRIFQIFMLGLIYFWILGWWYRGDLGIKILGQRHKDRVVTFKLSPYLDEFLSQTNKLNSEFRTLFMPPSLSPLFLNNTYQLSSQGGVPEYNYMKKPTFGSEFGGFSGYIEKSFCTPSPNKSIEIFPLLNIRYIVVRGDILPAHTYCAKDNRWDVYEVNRRIASSSLVNIVYSNFDTSPLKHEEFAVYEIKEQLFKPLIFSPKRLKTISSKAPLEVEEFVELVEPGLDYLFDTEFIPADMSDDTTNVTFKQINNATYKVNLSAKSTTIIIFSESFHPNWKLYSNYLFGKSILSERFHLLANNYANSWLIDPTIMCNRINCFKDGEMYNIEFYISFWPQRVYYLFSGVSLITLGISWVIFNKSVYAQSFE